MLYERILLKSHFYKLPVLVDDTEFNQFFFFKSGSL